jgi:hypothetical protein
MYYLTTHSFYLLWPIFTYTNILIYLYFWYIQWYNIFLTVTICFSFENCVFCLSFFKIQNILVWHCQIAICNYSAVRKWFLNYGSLKISIHLNKFYVDDLRFSNYGWNLLRSMKSQQSKYVVVCNIPINTYLTYYLIVHNSTYETILTITKNSNEQLFIGGQRWDRLACHPAKQLNNWINSKP